MTDVEFERLSWHDNAVYGLRFVAGDPDRDDWRSDLILDIDHITEWICDDDGTCRFRVAPADLTFHNVTDLSIAADWSRDGTGYPVNINEMSIDAITREIVKDQKICLDQPYYRWRITFNLPQGGEIAFGASSFSQTLRCAPVVLDQQKFSPLDRP